MPFNGSGTFDLITPQYPAVTNTTIRSDYYNAMLQDLAAGLSLCVTRDGQSVLTTSFPLQDGTIAAPALTFQSESASGLYKIAAGRFGYSVGGIKRLEISASGLEIVGALTTSGGATFGGNGSFTGTLSATGAFSCASATIGNVSNAEIQYLDGTTANIQLQLDLKAPLASPALTGTPTAPTPASSDSSTKIATTAFVQNVAMNSALPNQAGQANKFAKTDGTNTSWQHVDRLGNLTTDGVVLTNGGAGTVQVANLNIKGGISLNASGGSLAVGLQTWAAPTIPVSGSTYTLPDLTVIGHPPLVVSPNSVATTPANLTTSDNWSISTGFVAGTFAAIMATHAQSAHGAWGTKAMLPPQVGAVIAAGASPVSALSVIGSVQLDTNLYVLMLAEGVGGAAAASACWAVAVNTSTWAIGAKVELGDINSTGFESIYKISATEFICHFKSSAGSSTAIAGSVSGTTITLGTGVSPGDPAQRMTQLSATTYAFALNAGSDLVALTVSGTTLTLGVAVASGAYGNGVGNILIAPVTATTFLALYLATGGASATTRLLSARVGTVNTGDASITLAANVNTGGNTMNNFGIKVLRTFAAGGPYITGVSPSAGGVSFCALTVSGTTPTFGALTNRAGETIGSVDAGSKTLVYRIDEKYLVLNSTTLLLGHLATGPYVITVSGTALTFGSATALSAASTKVFLRDLNTNTNLYAVGGGVYDKITVSGTTITSTDSFTGGSPTLIYSDTLNDKAAKYSSTWYAWTLNLLGGLTTTIMLFRNGTNDISLNGPLS